MDFSITLITPENMRERGAEAYDQGLGEHDHGLVDREAIKHWQAGWHIRRVERAQERNQVQQLAEVSPP